MCSVYLLARTLHVHQLSVAAQSLICFHGRTSRSPAAPAFRRPSQRRTDKDVWAAAAARRQRSDADELGALEALAAAESRSKQTDKGPRCAWEE